MKADIKIKIRETGISAESSVPLPIDELLLVYLSLCLNAMKQLAEQAPEDLKVKLKDTLYDMFNYGASNVLAKFAPEIEKRAHLTTDAILKAENELLNDPEYTKKFGV